MPDYQMTREQFDLVWRTMFDMPVREADYQVVQYLPGGRTPANVAEYIWDHWLGEPEDVTPAGIEDRILEIIDPEHPQH